MRRFFFRFCAHLIEPELTRLRSQLAIAESQAAWYQARFNDADSELKSLWKSYKREIEAGRRREDAIRLGRTPQAHPPIIEEPEQPTLLDAGLSKDEEAILKDRAQDYAEQVGCSFDEALQAVMSNRAYYTSN